MAVAKENKIVRGNDLTYIGQQIKANFVAKDGSKVLSTNDYTTAEKNKLAGIAAGAEVNVNADWNAASGDAQILNKPTIPSKTSDLANDSGFITASDVPAGVQPATVAPLMDGTAAVGSSAKYAKEDHVHPSDTSKANVASPTFTGAVTISLLDKTLTIHPDGLIEMEDNSSSPVIVHEVQLPEGGGIGDVLATEYYVTSAIANKANKATTLAGYGITDAYTKTQTDSAISSAVSDAMIGGFVVMSSLPTASASTMGKIYLIPNSGTGTNVKDEYITIRSGNEGAYTYSWELLGTTQIDLTNYVTHDEFDPRLTTAEIDTLLAL